MFHFFFFNDTATTEIYTLSLHDALPIYWDSSGVAMDRWRRLADDSTASLVAYGLATRDRKSTRLNSSHGYISYAVFCLKKKKDQEPAACLACGGAQVTESVAVVAAPHVL